MSEQVPVGAAQPVADPSDWAPPGGELLLDELFPNPELAKQAPAPGAPTAPPQAAPSGPFLKASTGTVYNTLEDAVRGTEEKDRTIDRLKKQLEQFQATPPGQREAPHTPTADEFKRQIFQRLRQAAEKGDEVAYMDAIGDYNMALMSQFAPSLTGVVEDQAIRTVEAEAKDFRSWLGSPEYQQTLEKFPLLASAIQSAKNDPRLTGQLGEFYRLAYRAYAAERVPQVATQIAQTAQPSAPARPTLSSSTPTPIPNNLPQRGPQLSREQVLSDRAARTEFLKRFREERGTALETRFGDIGL